MNPTHASSLIPLDPKGEEKNNFQSWAELNPIKSGLIAPYIKLGTVRSV